MDNKIHEFDPEIYPRKLWVAVGVPHKAIADMFEDVAPMEKSDDACVACTRRLKPDVKGGVLIRFANKQTMTTANIAHEAVHAATEIFCYVGAWHDPKNQEPFAYLVWWVANCIGMVKDNKIKD